MDKKIEFWSDDIVRRLHYADLGEDGDFYADYILLDYEEEDLDEPITNFRAYGTWKRYKGEDVISTPGIITVLEIENAPTYRDVLEGNVSPGQLFQVGWEDWTVEEA